MLLLLVLSLAIVLRAKNNGFTPGSRMAESTEKAGC